MKLQQLQLENYRGISSLTLDLDGKCAVFYGINGTGKTSILRGVTQLFSDIIAKNSDGQLRQQVSFEKADIKSGSVKLTLHGIFRFDDNTENRYYRSYKKGGVITRKAGNAAFNEAFSEQYLGEAGKLPIFSYYSVNRAVLDIPVRIRTKHDFGRISAYQNSIGRTDFRTFFEWFRNQEDIENQEKVSRQDLSYTDPALHAVRAAIQSMIPELTDIRIVRNPLRMCAVKNGTMLSVDQFSDGEKCLLAMLGDIARRLALANPDTEDPLLGGGIVLIDEVDLHMHPAWQRQIAPVLHRTFPNIQFLLTTHSPLVIGGLDQDFKIFQLAQEETDVTVREIAPAYYDANMVLSDKMGTPYISPVVDELTGQIFRFIEEREFDRAEEELRELRRLTNGSHPAITRATILIARLRKTAGRAGQ